MVFPCGVRLTVDTTPLTPILLTLGPTTAAEAHAKRERELAESLAQLAVTRAEAALFLTVQYGIHVEPSHLIRCALGDGHDFSYGQCRYANRNNDCDHVLGTTQREFGDELVSRKQIVECDVHHSSIVNVTTR